jgi:pantoate--beta-alanine ligase
MALPATLHRCPIVREADGLAMSSRNVRLDPDQRNRSTAIYKALNTIRETWCALPGSGLGAPAIAPLVAKATGILEAAGFRIDYVSIADRETLQPIADDAKNAVALIAAFMGEVRLIDNMEIR